LIIEAEQIGHLELHVTLHVIKVRSLST